MKIEKDRFTPYRPGLDRLIFGLALFGILVVVHLWLMSGRGFDRGCLGFSEPDPTFDCEAVVQSEAGQLFGISNVVWGFLFYLLVAWMSAAVVLVNDPLRERIKQARAVLLAFGVIYSSYLVYVQYVQLGEYCLLCLMSAATVLVLLLVQGYELIRAPAGIHGLVRRARPGEGRLYAGMAAVLLVVAIADVAYFKTLPVAAPAAALQAEPSPAAPEPGACTYADDLPPVSDYDRFFSQDDPYLGRSDAPVTVIEFFDLNCPHCRAMHPIMNEVIAANGDRARFYLIPYVVFPYSVMQTEALYVAAEEGHYFEMIDAQFAHQRQGGLPMADLRRLASELGMDPDRFQERVEQGRYTERIRRLREDLRTLGLRGVPAVMINGRVVDGASRSVACLNRLIAEAAGGGS